LRGELAVIKQPSICSAGKIKRWRFKGRKTGRRNK